MLDVVRKVVTYKEVSYIEGGKAAPIPLQFFAAAAVVANPWHGQGFVENLRPQIQAVAPPLAEILTSEIISMAGSGDLVEGYGKAAVVGAEGEVEHASALIHTTRGGPGCPIMIPLMHKHDAGMRSHYLTIQFNIADAPRADEIVVCLGASIGGRPHHRIGDRYQDLEELGDTDVVV